MADDYTPPTQEELHRVAVYWERVKLMACEHTNGFTFDGSQSGPQCSDCGQRLHFMTDIQLETMRKREPFDAVREGIIRQAKRGGITYLAADGNWVEVRFTAHHDPGRGIEHEYACIPVEAMVQIIQATEVR